MPTPQTDPPSTLGAALGALALASAQAQTATEAAARGDTARAVRLATTAGRLLTSARKRLSREAGS